MTIYINKYSLRTLATCMIKHDHNTSFYSVSLKHKSLSVTAGLIVSDDINLIVMELRRSVPWKKITLKSYLLLKIDFPKFFLI